ncbi:serine-threonine/tyrosine-protein kinase catalytic domain-containing protein, partial [Tanacetum coccineum]
FKEVKKLGTRDYYRFTCRLESFMFSPHCDYACYLVFKLKGGHILSNVEPIFNARYNLGGKCITITPTLKPKEKSGSSKSVEGGLGMSKHYADSTRNWVEKRDDGWLEARLTKPLSKPHFEFHEGLMIFLWKIEGGSLSGIIVEGVEFRPVVVDNGWIISGSNIKG